MNEGKSISRTLPSLTITIGKSSAAGHGGAQDVEGEDCVNYARSKSVVRGLHNL